MQSFGKTPIMLSLLLTSSLTSSQRRKEEPSDSGTDLFILVPQWPPTHRITGEGEFAADAVPKTFWKSAGEPFVF
jgi:hypothetical protein